MTTNLEGKMKNGEKKRKSNIKQNSVERFTEQEKFGANERKYLKPFENYYTHITLSLLAPQNRYFLPLRIVFYIVT